MNAQFKWLGPGVLIAACCVAAGANDTPPNLKLAVGISCSVVGPDMRVEFAHPGAIPVDYDTYRATAQIDYAKSSGLPSWIKLIAIREARHTKNSQRELLKRTTADCDQWIETTRRQVLKAQGAK